MQRITTITLLLGLLIITVTSCGEKNSPEEENAVSKDHAADASLTGTTWRLDTIVEAGESAPAPDGNATITLDGSGTIKLGSYCNNGSGKVKLEKSTMDIGAIMMTMRACEDPEKGKAESAMTKVLNGKVSFAVEGETLTITNGDQSLGFSAG